MQKLLTLILVIILLISVAIVSNRGYDITTPAGLASLGHDILGWLSQVGQNAWRLTGHAIDMRWLPANTTQNITEVKPNATAT